MEERAEDDGPPPTRWEVELEFVQGLANPMYVHFLAQQKYLEDPDFLRYLEYLEYWRRPPHLKFVAYPNCLLMLTLLRQPAFRAEIAKAEVARMVMDGFFRKWQGAAQEPPAAPPADQPAAPLPPTASASTDADERTSNEPASAQSASVSPADSASPASPTQIPGEDRMDVS